MPNNIPSRLMILSFGFGLCIYYTLRTADPHWFVSLAYIASINKTTPPEQVTASGYLMKAFPPAIH